MTNEAKLRRERRIAWIVALIVVIPVFGGWLTLKFIVRQHLVPTYAMSPTIHARDRVLVNRFSYTFGDPPKVGDIANFRHQNTLFIFRIVGGPGDTLEMHDNVLFRNGKEVDEPYIMITPDVAAVRSFGPVTVTPGHYFFMGDNRDNANDSRFLGLIAKEQIRGRLVRVLHVGECPDDHPL